MHKHWIALLSEILIFLQRQPKQDNDWKKRSSLSLYATMQQLKEGKELRGLHRRPIHHGQQENPG